MRYPLCTLPNRVQMVVRPKSSLCEGRRLYPYNLPIYSSEPRYGIFFHSFPLMSCVDPEGGTGHPDPHWKITKLQGALSILVWIPWKTTKLLRQQSMLDHHRPASETPLTPIGPPVKSHLNGASLADRRWPAFSGIRILFPLIN